MMIRGYLDDSMAMMLGMLAGDEEARVYKETVWLATVWRMKQKG
jgi:hypothetical protein